MKQRIFHFSPIVALLLCAIAGSTLSSCAVVSREMRREADPGITFQDLKQDPDRYVGETMILGGHIIETRNLEEETRIMVMQAPLSIRQEPKERDLSEGRFILVYDDFLDPEIYERERKITVAGEVLGSEAVRINKRLQVLPVLYIREAHLFRDWRDPVGFHYHDPFYPWPDPYFRHRPYPYLRW